VYKGGRIDYNILSFHYLEVKMNFQANFGVSAGQIYLDEEKNTYVTVIRRRPDQVQYAGPGFRGQMDEEKFLNRFPPVDPVDVSQEELDYLISLCPPGTEAKVGYIKE